MPVPLFPSRLDQLLSTDRAEVTARRLKIMTVAGSLVALLLGIGWSTFHMLNGKVMLGGLCALLAVTAAVQLALALSGRSRAAALVAVVSMPVIVTALALADTPLDGVPRSTHMFPLPIAVGSYFLFEDGPRFWRLIPTFICLALWLVLASSNIGITDPAWRPLPNGRAAAAWTNNAGTLVTLFLFAVAIRIDARSRRILEVAIRRAIARGEFALHFQPQVDADGRTIGAEALLRWHHPYEGEIVPGRFIGVAEETGLIVPIGGWVLEAACAELSRWQADPLMCSLKLAVNVSPLQLSQPGFVDDVIALIRRSGIDPTKLQLEVTEHAVMTNLDEMSAKMTALSGAGVTWAIDDFGTGYSSLSALERLPFDLIKIDRSFISPVVENRRVQRIVHAIIGLAKDMNIAVLAEGVETEAQRQWLIANGCARFQGFLFDRPLGRQGFLDHMARWRPAAKADRVIGLDVAV